MTAKEIRCLTCGERFGSVQDSFRHVKATKGHKLTVKFLDSWNMEKEGEQHNG